MDYDYLKKSQYDWNKDTRNLKEDTIYESDNKKVIPADRCLHCGRLFVNVEYGISFCRDCDRAMSMAKDGVKHDYDSFVDARAQYDRREKRIPIEFEDEELIGIKPKFVTAAGEEVKGKE